jgi:hypothetical protein
MLLLTELRTWTFGYQQQVEKAEQVLLNQQVSG